MAPIWRVLCSKSTTGDQDQPSLLPETALTVNAAFKLLLSSQVRNTDTTDPHAPCKTANRVYAAVFKLAAQSEQPPMIITAAVPTKTIMYMAVISA